MENTQINMFYDTYEDAIRDTITGLGGNKKVGYLLWPTMPVDEAGRKLANCLNADKRDKLDIRELRLIRQAARQAGVHILAHYEATDAGYAAPQPIEPEDERAALQREFVQATKALQALICRMDRVGLQAVA